MQHVVYFVAFAQFRQENRKLKNMNTSQPQNFTSRPQNSTECSDGDRSSADTFFAILKHIWLASDGRW